MGRWTLWLSTIRGFVAICLNKSCSDKHKISKWQTASECTQRNTHAYTKTIFTDVSNARTTQIIHFFFLPHTNYFIKHIRYTEAADPSNTLRSPVDKRLHSLLTYQGVPGMMPGTVVEHSGSEFSFNCRSPCKKMSSPFSGGQRQTSIGTPSPSSFESL